MRELPVVFGAVTTGLGVLGGVVQSLHDDVVVLSSHGGLAGSPGDAVELALVSTGVEKETHPSGQVRLGHRGGGLAGPASHSSSADEAEHHDGNLESDEDDEVGQVQGEDLAAGGGSGDDLKGCLQQGSAFCSCQS